MNRPTPSDTAASLDTVGRSAREAHRRGLPPVHLWDPPYCGDIGLRIARDGTWLHEGRPIQRPALVRLFSTILRRDPERYVLVTPVEKVHVAVEDAPFLAVEMRREGASAGATLAFRTNVDDWAVADETHPLRFEQGPDGGLRPYLLIRAGLWARLTRALTYDLIELGETRLIGGARLFGIASSDQFFPIGSADEIESVLDA